MMRLRFVLASVVILGVIGLGLTVYAQSRDGNSKSAPRALLQISKRVPFILNSLSPPLTDDEYRAYVQTQIRILTADRILNEVVRDRQLAELHLDPEKLRSQIIVKEIEGTELIEIKLMVYKPSDASLIINTLLDKYQITTLGADLQSKDHKHMLLKKIWESRQDELQAKRESLRRLRETADENEPQMMEFVRQRLAADILELDRLEIFQADALARVEYLKGIKAPSPEEVRSLRKNEEEVAVFASQVKLLRSRVQEGGKRHSNVVDLTREQEEIELGNEMARQIGREVERLAIEKNAPSRIVVVQPASAK